MENKFKNFILFIKDKLYLKSISKNVQEVEYIYKYNLSITFTISLMFILVLLHPVVRNMVCLMYCMTVSVLLTRKLDFGLLVGVERKIFSLVLMAFNKIKIIVLNLKLSPLKVK